MTAAQQGPAPPGPPSIDGSEARLEFALAAGRLGYWEMDFITRRLQVSDIFKANWGRDPAEPFGYDTLAAAIHPRDRELHDKAVDEAIATHGNLDVEYRNIWPDGSLHWLRVRGHAVYDRDGHPVRMAGISLDITDRKRIEETLREETRSLEVLNTVGTAIAGNLDLEGIVQIVTDAATELSGAQIGAFFYKVIDDKGESFTLYTISGTPRDALSKLPAPTNVFDATLTDAGVVRSDNITKDPRYSKSPPVFATADGRLPVVSYLAAPVVSRSGEVLGGLFFGHEREAIFTERAERIVAGIAAQAAIAIDNARLFQAAQSELAERRRVEAHQELLLAELNHRVKNTLAIVMSIATQTLRHTETAEAFRSGFEARILALAEAHNLLTDSNWEGAQLRAILDRVLHPYRGEGEPPYRFHAERDVSVGPKAAVALVMAFNELATNASKYGALSKPDGHIDISWKVIAGATPRLLVRWEESGGPTVKTPSRKGFGTRLIRGLSEDASGTVHMDFQPAGLICTFDMALPAGAAA